MTNPKGNEAGSWFIVLLYELEAEQITTFQCHSFFTWVNFMVPNNLKLHSKSFKWHVFWLFYLSDNFTLPQLEDSEWCKQKESTINCK